MNNTLVLDPGHGGSDLGATYFGRNEKDDTLRLAMEIGNILENAGVSVLYTRTADVYRTPVERADIANINQADYFVSLHRNASIIPNYASGVESLVYQNQGVAAQLAGNINGELESLGYTNLGILERPGVAILNRTNMPAISVGIGFIDNMADNIFFDANLEGTAFAVANGILEVIHSYRPKEQTLYRVQVGAFQIRENADQLLNQLLAQNFPAFIIYDDGLYKVQVGAFAVYDNVIRMEQVLRDYGYQTYITTR